MSPIRGSGVGDQGSGPAPASAPAPAPESRRAVIPTKVGIQGRCGEGQRRDSPSAQNAIERGDCFASLGISVTTWNMRSRVHEYGGGAYEVAGHTVVFVDDGDRCLWRLDLPGQPRAASVSSPQQLTGPGDPGIRGPSRRVHRSRTASAGWG